MDYSLPGSSVHGIFQARVLEWVAISFSRGSSRPRDQTQVSRIAGRHFTLWATREAGLGSSRLIKQRPRKVIWAKEEMERQAEELGFCLAERSHEGF